MSVTSINYLFTQHEHMLTAQVDGFEAGLHEISTKLHDWLIDHAGWQGTNARVQLRQVVWMQSQVRGQLNALGYGQLAQRFVSGYNEVEVFSHTILKALGRPDLELIPYREDLLQSLRDFDLSAFADIGNKAVRELSRQLTLNAVAGQKRSEVIRAMDQVLEGDFVGQGKLCADTALRAFDRTSNMTLWVEAGIDKFVYRGPADNVTRPFCASHVGHTYTLAEIKAMSNGSSRFSNVLVYGGGPRCRHTWTPQADANDQNQSQEA